MDLIIRRVNIINVKQAVLVSKDHLLTMVVTPYVKIYYPSYLFMKTNFSYKTSIS